MKIVSYNISSCTQDKVEQLFKLNADVYVVPEIACENKIKLPNEDEYKMKWNSNYPNKGLGVIWRENMKIKPADCYNEKLHYAIPLVYDDIFIIGFWPTKLQKNEKYKDIALDILRYYAPYFTPKTIITGDFNLFFKDSNHEADITPIKDFLEEKGFKSLYHGNNIEFGSEKVATYYHQFKKTQPFFLDYTFTNFSVSSFELKDFGRKFSDHVGQILCIK